MDAIAILLAFVWGILLCCCERSVYQSIVFLSVLRLPLFTPFCLRREQQLVEPCLDPLMFMT